MDQRILQAVRTTPGTAMNFNRQREPPAAARCLDAGQEGLAGVADVFDILDINLVLLRRGIHRFILDRA
jgi:hypothetical protein